jgi:nucleoside-diphosphate-sugar epimerase
MFLARRLVREGVQVRATTRTPERYLEIEETGAYPAFAEVLEPGTLVPLADWEPHVVFDLVRPQPIAPERYSVWGTMNVASAFAEHPLEALVYLSSTSVYGRRDGDWTDETTELRPTSPLGEARAESERVYGEIHREHGFPARICRAPGIYGPGRTLRQRLESGAYVGVDDELWVSRIHVDDLVDGLIAAWRRGSSGEVYLLCDDEPVSGQEYARLTASLLALPLPPAIAREELRQELSASAFERRIGDRRCSNRRMREELGVIPRYPSVREGLPSALRAEGAI